jgi:hypothetical protein
MRALMGGVGSPVDQCVRRACCRLLSLSADCTVRVWEHRVLPAVKVGGGRPPPLVRTPSAARSIGRGGGGASCVRARVIDRLRDVCAAPARELRGFGRAHVLHRARRRVCAARARRVCAARRQPRALVVIGWLQLQHGRRRRCRRRRRHRAAERARASELPAGHQHGDRGPLRRRVRTPERQRDLIRAACCTRVCLCVCVCVGGGGVRATGASHCARRAAAACSAASPATLVCCTRPTCRATSACNRVRACACCGGGSRE